jgi:DNA-binding winged helix-turn-helix (wHTH) protein
VGKVVEEILIGRNRVDLAWREARCGSRVAKLEPKAAEVLRTLLENRGTIVSRSTLLDRAWPFGAGSDEGLTQTIAHLRRVLGENGHSQALLKTIPKQGYLLAVGENDSGAPELGALAEPRSRIAVAALAVAAGLLLLVLMVAARSWPAEQRPVIIQHLPPARPTAQAARVSRS